MLISRISKSNYLSFSKTMNTNNPFFFYLEQFLTKSYPITRNINETRIFIPPKTLSNPFFSAFSTSSRSFRLGQSLLDFGHEFHAGHSVYRDRKRERMDRVYPWTGPCNFVCRERFVCWKNIDGVLSRSSWPEERWKRRGDIDSKKIAECFSPRPARSLTVNCV